MKQTHILSLFVIALILLSTQVQSTSEENFSDEISYENLNIPGFSSKTIGNILAESQLREEKEEKYQSGDSFENLSSEKFSNNFEEADDDSSINMLETDENLVKPYIKEGKVELSQWFSITGINFGNNKKYPEVNTPDGPFSVDFKSKTFMRNNPMFKKGSGIPNKNAFWFRLSKYYLWYTYNKKEINIVGRIKIKNILDVRFLTEGKNFCFNPIVKGKTSWKICSAKKADATKFFCALLKLTHHSKDDKCDPKKYGGGLTPGKILIKTVTQPIIIIPTASHTCNTSWSYAKKGTDWECLCHEGMEQSPIDLPPASKGIETDSKPVFEYEQVEVKMADDYGPAKIGAGDNNVIRYDEEALRILHPNFGKIVTLDGAVYYAQEIVFHTPSEHTINGVKFDMEMQIKHYGKSVGDTLKSVILSFLFKSKPGAFNKFIDKLDFFDLPNPQSKARELNKALFIPQILQDSNEENMSIMKPFSFYTYQGSHTAPPCAEKTIHYVASTPIELSSTALEMFKESLRVPDMMDAAGNVHVSNSVLENNRHTQPLHGRAVFHYDHTNFNCPTFKKGKQGGYSKRGHYEKRATETTEYFFVNGEKPSGIANAFVVTNKEALGDKAKSGKKKH